MKTIAIRLDDELHAQLSIVAQLEESTITDFIREAIDARVTAKRSQPELAAKATAVLEAIDTEAQNRRSAIATLFGNAAEGTETAPSGGSRRRKPSEG